MSDSSLAESIDTEQLLEDVDIEDVLQQMELWELLRQLPLETVLGGFGAAAGSEVGAILGRKVDAALSTAENEPTDESSSDEDESTTDTANAEDSNDTEADETDADVPDTREELEALSYRELQSLAAETDVKGNISQERMVEELAEEFGLDGE